MAKILLVDDDQDFVAAVKAVLVNEGHDVKSGYNRSEGMALIKAEDPDMIILDVMMEEMDDGFTMAHDLRKEGITKPILMLSSVGKISGMKFDKDSDMVPVDAFEEKPIRPEKLVERINELLSA